MTGGRIDKNTLSNYSQAHHDDIIVEGNVSWYRQKRSV